jgi:hypothetical protein
LDDIYPIIRAKKPAALRGGAPEGGWKAYNSRAFRVFVRTDRFTGLFERMRRPRIPFKEIIR